MSDSILGTGNQMLLSSIVENILEMEIATDGLMDENA